MGAVINVQRLWAVIEKAPRSLIHHRISINQSRLRTGADSGSALPRCSTAVTSEGSYAKRHVTNVKGGVAASVCSVCTSKPRRRLCRLPQLAKKKKTAKKKKRDWMLMRRDLRATGKIKVTFYWEFLSLSKMILRFLPAAVCFFFFPTLTALSVYFLFFPWCCLLFADGRRLAPARAKVQPIAKLNRSREINVFCAL